MQSWTRVAMVLCLVLPASGAWSSELPFRPISAAGEHFTASNLTMTYEKDSSLFLSLEEISYLDLDDLDLYGEPRYADDSADPTRRVYSDTLPDNVAEMTEEEKDAATPPTAGVQVGVPSYISVPGTLIGGAAMLIHVLSELF